jgi:hypothetical protein
MVHQLFRRLQETSRFESPFLSHSGGWIRIRIHFHLSESGSGINSGCLKKFAKVASLSCRMLAFHSFWHCGSASSFPRIRIRISGWCGSGSGCCFLTLIRIRILLYTLLRIRADPHPKHYQWMWWYGAVYAVHLTRCLNVLQAGIWSTGTWEPSWTTRSRWISCR